MPKILVSIPCGEYIRPKCFQSVYNMKIPSGVEREIETTQGYGVAMARNMAACQAIDDEYDYIMYIDSDQIVPPNALEKLYLCGENIAAGWSMMSVADRRTNISIYNQKGMVYTFINRTNVPKDKLFTVDAIGFSCILIKTQVFSKMAYPYFRYVEYPNRTVLSEDLYFCGKAREKGFRIVCDSSLPVYHIKEVSI